MSVILYARVSTADQTLAHQQTQAESAGFKFDMVIADEGVSGVSVPLRERAEGRHLFRILRSGDTLVVRWVDRLGRNYADVTDTIREFMRRGVVIKTIINGLTFDGATNDPVQMAVRDALIAFMAATAQAQAEATKEAQKAGIAHAKATEGAIKYRGRKPGFDREQFERVCELLAQDTGASEIAKLTGVTRQTIYRIKDHPAEQIKALETWGLWAPRKPLKARSSSGA
ncbi:Transposon Tn3 resolvase [Starkeya nomas]|uniref:Transposon Tn3 resolvase n=1 Tax=Starkeya nomas TaxID=2666134 RepID=A0A5S9NSE2_9HYPH|nr:recombinase family protein [Starkeya nomas]CAA0093346.1 Transposon Tn3 resolvase [Starkeya nomas]